MTVLVDDALVEGVGVAGQHDEAGREAPHRLVAVEAESQALRTAASVALADRLDLARGSVWPEASDDLLVEGAEEELAGNIPDGAERAGLAGGGAVPR